MNDDLLNAECVIQHLHDQDFILLHDKRWVFSDNNMIEVQFPIKNKSAVITLQFVKITGQYFIPRTRIRILACLYEFDADTIYLRCTM
jgi:hypothetical protein